MLFDKRFVFYILLLVKLNFLKEMLPPLPVIYVKAVAMLSTWEPSAVGYVPLATYGFAL